MIRRTACLLALAALHAAADIGPKPRSDAPGLQATGDMKGIDVEMAAEDVRLVLRRSEQDKWADRLDVTATFDMKNSGAEAAFEEGFPIGPVKNMKGFEVEIDGKKVEPKLVDRFENKVKPVTEAQAEHYDDSGKHDYWYVWDAAYPAGATRVHRVKYALEYFGFSEYRNASYTLSTGARWKGPIGKALVTLQCEGGLTLDHLRSARPLKGATRTADALTWSFENLEPTAEDDVEIQYNTSTTWADDLARLREEAELHWSARKEAAWSLLHAHERFARATRSPEERAACLDAIRSMLDEGREKDGGWDFPAEERRRVQIGDDVSPEERAEIEKSIGNEAREYALPGQSAQLFEFFDALLEAAREDSKSAPARAALERWVAVADAFLAGKVTAGGKALAPANDDAAGELKKRVAAARDLLKE